MDSTMGGKQSPPMQKRRNGRQYEKDSSGNHNGRRRQDCIGRQQQRWTTAAQWAAGWQSNCNGQWDNSIVMDGTMGSRQLPLMQKRCNGRMNGSGNHDGRRQQDHDRRRQRRWATAAQRAAGWQSNCTGQWEGSGAMDGTMGGGQLLSPMQKWRNGR
jgi:hypothetical protein